MSLSVILMIAFNLLNAQESTPEKKEFTPSSKVSGKIFANFHSTMEGDSITEHAFELVRAYFGYKSQFHENWSAQVKLDIGNFEQSEYSIYMRYAYFKNAYLKYNKGKLSTYFGLIDLYQHKTQEKFWGYRYIYKSFQDKHKFSKSADIGVSAHYKFFDKLSADLTISNGEGYKATQNDKIFKYALGVTINPVDDLTVRIYGDYLKGDDNVFSASGFAGYKFSKKFRLGVEGNAKLNAKGDDKNQTGLSTYTTYGLTDKLEVFARFDALRSNLVDVTTVEEDGTEVVEEEPWNLKKDGSAILAGLQYKPMKKVKLSLNGQSWIGYAENSKDKYWMYLNVEVKF